MKIDKETIRSFKAIYTKTDVHKEKLKLNANFVTHTVQILKFLNRKISGYEINSNITGFSTELTFPSDEFIYDIKREKHFWPLLEDCTLGCLKMLNHKLVVAVMYIPHSFFYPRKIYRYVFELRKRNSIFRELLEKTSAPLFLIDEKEFIKENELFVALAEIRSERYRFRLFEPRIDELTLCKRWVNSFNLNQFIKRIWVPRKNEGLVWNFAVFDTANCFYCESLENLRPNGVILKSGDLNIGIIYMFCQNCLETLGDECLFEKLIKQVSVYGGAFNDAEFKAISTKEYFEMILEKLKKEDIPFQSDIKKTYKELHIIFKHGFKLIISYHNMLDYAYVFINKDNEQIFKWDSRDDHNLESGFDHFHFDKENFAKNVKSSYFIGNFLIDFEVVYKNIKPYVS